MLMRSFAHPVATIRACEQVLLDAQPEPDHLMRQAAHAVAVAADTLLDDENGARICLLVGAGGNGGDALYAGAELAASGHDVHAILLGRDGRVHERALAAFEEAEGVVLDELTPIPMASIIIDGILGIGGNGGLSPEVGAWLRHAREQDTPILAVDVPSGVNADTGAAAEHHVTADVTVTFGGLRLAHAVSNACGEVLVADIANGVDSLAAALASVVLQRRSSPVLAFRALAPEREWPSPLLTLDTITTLAPLEPAAEDDKYSGGVVGVCAGSETYPGAGYLSTIGAVRATSSMVRYVGPLGRDVVRAVPEVVISGALADTGRVQAWVVGPGRGADEAELAELLKRPEPLLIDADALTLLAQSPELRDALRSRQGDTLLTPHAGEFRRIADAVGDIPVADPLAAVRALAEDLGCGVLLKGRRTILCIDARLTTVDAGSSWAATPGSGDVLAGMLGAWIARFGMAAVPEAVAIHAVAAWLSAQTPDGPAPTSASRIAEAIPQATARLTGRR
ncbi:bifunctional ADP-dependent NAD(P)H-hydrate dehydratase/NAD(P)H-hydrate epimerase [Corynebacterium sp.]|uniref:bifunctional ADP-dependent NAD(P)H-hydrate dehydratase/NAD(P)H-hydrate epimerase n=1 Tax=Corynebacterium sp. TaxID=1720 RepID=UPI0026E00EBE|nr:bifunctional ADP-dependent NAD(P)H-hydrate dehydratase/NAD(P)H-hydrate epimerase [Corynebacterium sp.]MDO5512059.1 bifunctional ADP-dependent NAD(P)H-hydrate dehydratase/NAD(P)H-hydrate epimerase [Corynebacterium sp.]